MKTLFKLLAAVIAAGTLCLLYGFLLEPRLLKIREVSLVSPHYQGGDIRIALLSDIHIGSRHVPAARVANIVRVVNNARPDIILMPGDFIGGHTPRENHSPAFVAEVNDGLAQFGALRAPLGVYASIGNHDVWYDAAAVTNGLRAAGVHVLANSVGNTATDICVVGLADHDTQTEDPTTFDRCTKGNPVIALMHSPDSFALLPPYARLSVAGHTHGGQINLPFYGRRVTATQAGRKYAYGLVNVRGVPAFVTAGIGTSILPARFRAPPEVVIITLRAGATP